MAPSFWCLLASFSPFILSLGSRFLPTAVGVDGHRFTAAPTHELLKTFQQCCFSRSVTLCIVADLSHRAGDAQMPQVVWRKFHLLPFPELLLCGREEPPPMVIES